MLRDWQIRSKLLGIFILPVIGLAALTSIRIAGNFHDGLQADREKKAVVVVTHAAALAGDLERERAQAVAWVAGDRSGANPVGAAQRASAAHAAAFRAAAARLTLGRGDARLQAALRAAGAALDRLPQVRQLASGRRPAGPATAGGTLSAYSAPIGALLDLVTALSAAVTHRDLARTMNAFEALARAQEAASEETAIGAAVAASGRFAGADDQRFAAAIGARQQALGRYQQVASPAQQALLAGALNTPSVDRAAALEQLALAARQAPRVGIATGDWLDAMEQRAGALDLAERQLAADLAAANHADVVAAERELLNSLLLLAIIGVLTVALATFLARAMINPLVALQRNAEELAARQLPRIVARLQRGQPVDLAAELAPIAVPGRDEIGRLAASFEAAQRLAVRIAAEQAALRRSVSDMFVNLARRSQALIDRQLELIDSLERNARDPARLEELFQIDHLATRMRRNAENLVVLSSAEPAHSWREPVPLIGLLRAAIAEVEDYQRVHVLPLDEVAVAGPVGIDLVHLLAELVENATRFSPPDTKVVITGEAVSKGYLVEIEDRGAGMTDEALDAANDRLANPPLLDFALARSLGFYVVGRLAQRHGIKAQLRHSPYGGITALVLLPFGVVLPLGEEGWRAGVGAWNQSWNQRGGIASLPTPDADAGDPLPIFEAARSDWVGGPLSRAYVPLRRHRAVPSRPEPPPQQPWPRPAPGAEDTAGPGAEDTAGPGAEDTAGPSAEPDAGQPPGAEPGARSPEDVRSLLHRYQAGLERGRRAAAATRTAGGASTPPSARGSNGQPEPQRP
jgi:signal transduction histidine kinase